MWTLITGIVFCLQGNCPNVKTLSSFFLLNKSLHISFFSSKKIRCTYERHAVIWIAYLRHSVSVEYSPGIKLLSFLHPTEETLTPKGPSRSLLIGFQEQQLTASLCAQYHINPIQGFRFFFEAQIHFIFFSSPHSHTCHSSLSVFHFYSFFFSLILHFLLHLLLLLFPTAHSSKI